MDSNTVERSIGPLAPTRKNALRRLGPDRPNLGVIASRRDLQAERRQSSGLSCRRPHPHRAANPGPARRTPALGVPDHSGAEGRSLSRSIYARQPASRARRPQRGLGTALTVQALAVRIDLGIAATFRGFSSIGQSAVLFCVGSSSDNPPSAAAALGVARAGHRRRGGQPRGGEAEANISASVAASSAREHRAQRVPRPVLSSDPPVERIVLSHALRQRQVRWARLRNSPPGFSTMLSHVEPQASSARRRRFALARMRAPAVVVHRAHTREDDMPV